MFPNAACVVTLIDRLMHRAEIVALEGESYRLLAAIRKRVLCSARHNRRFLVAANTRRAGMAVVPILENQPELFSRAPTD